MIKPILDRVVIRQKEDKHESESGLYVPDSATETHQGRGTILSSGQDVKFVAEGQEVIYDPRCASVFEHEGEVLHVVAEENILAILG